MNEKRQEALKKLNEIIEKLLCKNCRERFALNQTIGLCIECWEKEQYIKKKRRLFKSNAFTGTRIQLARNIENSKGVVG